MFLLLMAVRLQILLMVIALINDDQWVNSQQDMSIRYLGEMGVDRPCMGRKYIENT